MKFKTLLLTGVAAFGLYYYENSTLDITRINVESERLPEAFDGYRILQLSDLHGKEFGPNQSRILYQIKKCKPDIIVMTGDIIDHPGEENKEAMDLATGCVKIAPTYYISGNHEDGLRQKSDEFIDRLDKTGICILEDKKIILEKQNQEIILAGLADRSLSEGGDSLRLGSLISNAEDLYTILLSHHPEYMPMYVQRKVDLVFSGHAHGGQIRLPLLGGLYAPNQGILPNYTSGLYQINKTKMVVSRGLGPSRFPFRFHNRPNINLVTLHNVK